MAILNANFQCEKEKFSWMENGSNCTTSSDSYVSNKKWNTHSIELFRLTNSAHIQKFDAIYKPNRQTEMPKTNDMKQLFCWIGDSRSFLFSMSTKFSLRSLACISVLSLWSWEMCAHHTVLIFNKSEMHVRCIDVIKNVNWTHFNPMPWEKEFMMIDQNKRVHDFDILEKLFYFPFCNMHKLCFKQVL